MIGETACSLRRWGGSPHTCELTEVARVGRAKPRRTEDDHEEMWWVFIGIDTAKARNAVAVADAGRDGEIRYLGEFDNTPDATAKLVRKLSGRYETLHFCYEAGPTSYGLYRQILALGHEYIVVAPSIIPRRSGDRVKTNRLDAQSWRAC